LFPCKWWPIPGCNSSETDEDNREIAGAPEIFELQKDINKEIQSSSMILWLSFFSECHPIGTRLPGFIFMPNEAADLL
jgi:hypothetical protein